MTERESKAWESLSLVEDPEIPVISVVELGIVRSVTDIDGVLNVEITPTYSGCPATQVIEDSVIEALKQAQLEPIHVKTVLSPSWSTSMILESGKEKLKKYGVAPPADESTDKRALMGDERQINCPQCGSNNTIMVSQFGSTPCKAHFKCKDCLEPFDYFKCL
ncbi:MAG TPA: phenylacetate-CoA oxygenase subunit PaaJ [Flavobacteriales bacterium]|jgi:ring-1,2-phenylacetyl-CoA epoxidase subunit PaaD|nr:phenylacetate-CoA oxygenase subunit PaaJ [Flavobacteriales bacterium]HAW19661.1 phenylacetate-CoA oxygenase subunit PaaJ [Flavobacteriales bacterium]